MQDDVIMFEKMVTAATSVVDKATRPWKWAVICLVVAIAICVVGWVATSLRSMDTIDKLTDRIIGIEQHDGR